VTTMHLVAQYRQFATDYRRLAAMLTKLAHKLAMELLANRIGQGCRKSRNDARSKEPAEP